MGEAHLWLKKRFAFSLSFSSYILHHLAPGAGRREAAAGARRMSAFEWAAAALSPLLVQKRKTLLQNRAAVFDLM